MNKQEIEKFIFDVLNARCKILITMDMSVEKRLRLAELERIEQDFIKALENLK